ncbi:hypothetical protein EXVG_00198 [Emiliania huxleyi virus 202]|nr:hypothetical protein EXVG_00198 [Emiliania huxleyi virus 202]AHA54184.1 putative membrane protein [Emiliania huxleyi virus 18]AHA55230.1 putative membrane protein [Emiliania huxleyi virus 156]
MASSRSNVVIVMIAFVVTIVVWAMLGTIPGIGAGVVLGFILFRIFVSTSVTTEQKFLESTAQQRPDPTKVLSRMSSTSRYDKTAQQIELDAIKKTEFALRIRQQDAAADELRQQKEADRMKEAAAAQNFELNQKKQELELKRIEQALALFDAQKDVREVKHVEAVNKQAEQADIDDLR